MHRNIYNLLCMFELIKEDKDDKKNIYIILKNIYIYIFHSKIVKMGSSACQ